TFIPGQTTQTLTISVVGDLLVEPDETFQVVLSNPSGALFGRAQTTGTILDDDDSDHDGVSNAVESSGPSGGDANSDGIPDSEEAYVTSLPDAVDGRYVTLVSPTGTRLMNVQALATPAPGAVVPAGLIFPVGFFSFQVGVMTPGAATTVTLLLPPGVPVNTYEKYGPMPGIASDGFYSFDSNGSVGATFASDRVILSLV